MKRKETFSVITRLGWTVLVLGSLVILFSAIQKKEGNLVGAVTVKINPLPEGELLVSEKDVLLIIERTFGHQITGLPLASLSIGELERAVEKDPFVLNADVFIDAQNQVHIELDQRQPIIRIMDNNGLNYYMDELGNQLPLSKHVAARVLVATGNISPYLEDFREVKDQNLADVFQLGLLIWNDPFFRDMIEQIYTDTKGRVNLVPKIGDQTIRLGKPKDLEEKLDRLRVFYDEIIPREGWQKYSSVSLEFAGQLVCKK